MSSKKKQSKPRSIQSGVLEGIADIGKQTARTAVDQFNASLPFPKLPQQPSPDRMAAAGGSLRSPEQMGMNPPGMRKEKPQDVELFNFAERREYMETAEQIRKLVTMIKDEVKKIEAQNKTMISETARITVEQLPDKPGVYHVRFFEWLLGMLKDVRKKVSESSSWLSIAKGKQKKGFWAMAKKKGTSFTLSGERTPATQSG